MGDSFCLNSRAPLSRIQECKSTSSKLTAARESESLSFILGEHAGSCFFFLKKSNQKPQVNLFTCLTEFSGILGIITAFINHSHKHNNLIIIIYAE